MGDWIRVADKLPNNGEWVLCDLREINGIGTGDTYYRTLQYDGSLEYLIVPVWIEPFEGGGYTIDRVTHWIPLPTPPVDTAATPVVKLVTTECEVINTQAVVGH